MKANKWNTIDYTDLSEQRYEEQTVNHWSNNPCGTSEGTDAHKFMSMDFFDIVAKERYEEQGWLIEEFDS